ncbi:MAG: ABC transporter permease [Candidatus Dormibacteria bacterium]
MLLAILGIWELVSLAKIIKPVLASSPADVWNFLVSIGQSGELWTNLWATLEATLIAFVLGSVVGVFLGLCLAVLPRVERALDPLLNALNAMPRIALGPLFVLYFGFGLTAKVALGFSLAVFILMVNARAGALSVDPDLIRLSRALNASRIQTFTKVLLPSSVPSIFAGLRLGLIYALLGVITAEIIASQTGLGSRILYYSNIFDITGVYAILIVLAVVAAVLNTLMAMGERWLLRWRPSVES